MKSLAFCSKLSATVRRPTVALRRLEDEAPRRWCGASTRSFDDGRGGTRSNAGDDCGFAPSQACIRLNRRDAVAEYVCRRLEAALRKMAPAAVQWGLCNVDGRDGPAPVRELRC